MRHTLARWLRRLANELEPSRSIDVTVPGVYVVSAIDHDDTDGDCYCSTGENPLG